MVGEFDGLVFRERDGMSMRTEGVSCQVLGVHNEDGKITLPVPRGIYRKN